MSESIAQHEQNVSLLEASVNLTYENDSHNFLHFSNLNISLGAESKINSLCVFQSSRIGNL
jgi:hypothetical protein